MRTLAPIRAANFSLKPPLEKLVTSTKSAFIGYDHSLALQASVPTETDPNLPATKPAIVSPPLRVHRRVRLTLLAVRGQMRRWRVNDLAQPGGHGLWIEHLWPAAALFFQ